MRAATTAIEWQAPIQALPQDGRVRLALRRAHEATGKVQRGRYLYCPNGGHMAMYDDQKVYFEGLVRFLQDVDAGRF